MKFLIHFQGQATMSGNERSNMEPNVHNVNVKTSEESGKFQIRLLIDSPESYNMTHIV